MKNSYKQFFAVIALCLTTGYLFAAGHTVNINRTNCWCFNTCNGTASAVVTGGTGPFTYVWTPGNLTTANINNLCAGIYTVVVTDQADASTATATVSITQPASLPTLSVLSVNNALCNQSNGSATVTVMGGTSPYTFNWSPCCGNSATLSNASPGTYTCTVTDSNGCNGFITVTISNQSGPTAFSISAAPGTICNGGSSVLTTTVIGGTAPYTYLWTNPGNSLSSTTSSSPTATPTTTTTYTATVSDANGCVLTNTTTVAVNQAVTASITATDPTCNQNNGSLALNVTQAAPPYSILWSNAQTTPVISNLSAGLYSVTVTDNNGCTLGLSTGLNNMGGPILSTSATSTGCTNANNGSVTVTPSGIAPFTYVWNTNPVQTTATAAGLTAGNYMVSVTDALGCVTTAPQTVNALTGNLFFYAQQTSVDICNSNSGAATTMVMGGTQPYSYAWSNGATTPAISGVTGGVYTVTVSDVNGCSLSGFTYIPAFCANYLHGRVYLDVNQDGVYNAGDFPLSGKMIEATPNAYTASTDINGEYYSWISGPDTFVVSMATINQYYQLTAPLSGYHTVIFPGLNDTASADFVFTVPNPVQDLYLSLASGVPRPGFTQTYSVFCENRGSTAVSDTIWFRHDTILSLVSATPPFDGYSHPEGYWLFSNFTPAQTISKQVIMQVPTIQNGGYIGRPLLANARIEPTSSDVTSPNNGDDENDVIQGSYDPNMKECWSPTMNANGDIWPSDTALDYTIHFQNTGTDTAFFITVVDTLPAELDVTTFEPGASSHPYTWNISGANDTNIVTFTFMNILLVDSFRNEPMSHGYVQFSIERDPNLPIGTAIENRAGIYFDFNLPVMTNYSVATIWNPLTVETGNASSFTIYPNPAQDRVNVLLTGDLASGNATITLRDISGRAITSVNSNGNSNVVLDTQGCASGMYFITITSVSQETITQPVIISAQ